MSDARRPSNSQLLQIGRIMRTSLIMMLTGVAMASPVVAQSTLPDSTTKKIDAVFSRYGSLDNPGCAVGVYQNGKIAFERGYGASNIEYGVPLTPTTPMIMGSVS